MAGRRFIGSGTFGGGVSSDEHVAEETGATRRLNPSTVGGAAMSTRLSSERNVLCRSG